MKCDLLIAGSGPAGIVAAIAAKRAGVRVTVLDSSPMPGGMISNAGINSMLTFHGLNGNKIIGGLPQQLIDRLIAMGGSKGHISDTVGVAYSVTPISPAAYSVLASELFCEYGIEYYPSTSIYKVDCVQNGENRSINAVFAASETNSYRFEAQIYIDGTGGNLSELAGAFLLPKENGENMPYTLIFNIAGVELERVKQYMLANREEFHYETLWEQLQDSPAIGVSGFFSLWKEANLSVPRDRILFYQTLSRDEVAINSTRIFSRGQSMAEAYCEGLQQIYEIFNFAVKKLPGFEHGYISYIPSQIGIREKNRILGEYILRAEDVLSGARFADEVTFGGFPVDIHSASSSGLASLNLSGNGFYGIPYRCFIAKNFQNLLISGRAISAEFKAHASARVQATAMGGGEACGLAAALCIKKRIEPSELDPQILRERLSDSGAILEP